MKKLSDINKNFSQWYQDVLELSDFIDKSPVKGCFVLKPNSYAIWENIQSILNKKIKETGTKNAYFPLLIPESFIKKEADHLDGFAPELAVVTYAGGKKLDKPLVVRPTSETIIYHMFARWIKSWRDLPLKINQWANVVRWELRTRPFLRSTEFLWQEGHTAHANKQEADTFAQKMLDVYKKFVEEYLAIPVIAGQKTETERFAGADQTYTIEALMQDGKALQLGTSHLLNHNFSKSFDIKFQDKDGTMESPYCTSWGLTTRLIGALIMTHGDNRGIIVPPKIAPIQVIIVPIYKGNAQLSDKILSKAFEIKTKLEKMDVKVEIDTDDSKSPGNKFFKWEIQGVPVRIEIGAKDLEKNSIIVVNRIIDNKIDAKKSVPIDDIENYVPELLDEIQLNLFKKAKNKLEKNIHLSDKLDEFGPLMEKNNGLYQVGWCGSRSCEAKLKEYKGSIRCILNSQKSKKCFACGKNSKYEVLVAKAY